ncbi:hypothetical protein MPSEU_000196100 [Mayamaea pseudoterrestris]|nr:hypothetical protein MPSEU_000196100 [Mayamaea pseudoterrestris]
MNYRQSAFLVWLLAASVSAFTVQHPIVQTSLRASPNAPSTTLYAKGFGSDSSSKSSESSSSSTKNANSNGAQLNWCPTLAKVSDLPQTDGSMSIIDTNLTTLKNGATNPTGAVSVARIQNNVYCYGVNCPQCKIPLTKAMLLSASTSSNAPRLACTFCKSTYNLNTGAKVETAKEVSGGIISGIVKSVFAAQDGGPLPIYKLGEKNGKVLIALD